MKPGFSKYFLIVAAFLLFGVFTVLLMLMFTNSSSRNQRSESELPTPTRSTSRRAPSSPQQGTLQADPPAIGELPREGYAIITSAPVVRASEQEVAKLRPQLPYLREFTTTNNKTLSIVIPDEEYQDDPWKLTAQIFGVDFQIPTSNRQYEQEKQAFLEGASHIFGWIKDQGADPNKVIIKWGDRAFIQERAEQWLAEGER